MFTVRAHRPKGYGFKFTHWHPNYFFHFLHFASFLSTFKSSEYKNNLLFSFSIFIFSILHIHLLHFIFFGIFMIFLKLFMAYGPKNSDYGSGSNIIQCQYVQSVHGYQVSVVPPWGSCFHQVSS